MKASVVLSLLAVGILSIFLLLTSCQSTGDNLPSWIPVPDAEDLYVNPEIHEDQTTYIISVSTKQNLQEIHSFYNQAFQTWQRLQWDYQPAQQSLDIMVSTDNKQTRKIKVVTLPDFQPTTNEKIIRLQIIATEKMTSKQNIP